MIIVCEFRLGKFHNREKFIINYTRRVCSKAVSFARNPQQVEDYISIGLLTLAGIPDEVHSGRLIDNNIIGYTLSRVRTRCIEYRRSDHLMKVGYHALRLGKVKPIHRVNYNCLKSEDEYYFECILNTLQYKSDKCSELLEDIYKAAKTDFDTIIINYSIKGYSNREIAYFLGCSESKISRSKKLLEERYNANILANK